MDADAGIRDKAKAADARARRRPRCSSMVGSMREEQAMPWGSRGPEAIRFRPPAFFSAGFSPERFRRAPYNRATKRKAHAWMTPDAARF